MGKRCEAFEVIFQLNSIDGEELLDAVISIFDCLNLSKNFYLNNKQISAGQLLKKIKQKKRWPTDVSSDNFEIEYLDVGYLNHAFLLIKEINTSSVNDWNVWISPFSKLKGFLQAWIVDVEYSYWQNAYDPLQFEAVGRDYSHLPMKSNGLPYPVGKQIIDVSQNPGRRTLRNGYVEAVGSVMWLGVEFWKLTGDERRKQLKDINWLSVQELDNGVIKLIALDKPFCDESTAEIQNKIREVLYL